MNIKEATDECDRVGCDGYFLFTEHGTDIYACRRCGAYGTTPPPARTTG